MGLDSPRPCTAFGFQGMFCRWIELPMQRQIRESLLCYVRVLVFLVRADCMQRLYTIDADNAAKYIGLFQV